MALVRCRNGHLYDPSKSNACPYCGVSDLEPGKTAAKANPGEHDTPRETMGHDAPHELTQGFFKTRFDFDPPVGWIVCIDGPVKGKDYRVYSENNSIGRSETMRICISGDDSIARENHAVLTYDPEANAYYIRPGTATGLAWHNRAAVFGPVELKPFDEIKLGKSTFLFVPLCGEFGSKGFRWS
ncbi:MAG: FHA domain-containing protein [Bryobacteraceae bacterium]